MCTILWFIAYLVVGTIVALGMASVRCYAFVRSGRASQALGDLACHLGCA
jgi:hypothetical protein